MWLVAFGTVGEEVFLPYHLGGDFSKEEPVVPGPLH
jgi:hypothetical protein